MASSFLGIRETWDEFPFPYLFNTSSDFLFLVIWKENSFPIMIRKWDYVSGKLFVVAIWALIQEWWS